MDDKLLKVITDYAAVNGLTASQVESRISDVFQSTAWKRRAMLEQQETVSRLIAARPEWQRRAAHAQLNRPYVEPPDRGEDGHARW